MDRWTGVLYVPLSRGGPLFRVAASLLLSPAKTLAVRPKNSAPAPAPARSLFLFSEFFRHTSLLPDRLANGA
jgi:hypothetical protein